MRSCFEMQRDLSAGKKALFSYIWILLPFVLIFKVNWFASTVTWKCTTLTSNTFPPSFTDTKYVSQNIQKTEIRFHILWYVLRFSKRRIWYDIWYTTSVLFYRVLIMIVSPQLPAVLCALPAGPPPPNKTPLYGPITCIMDPIMVPLMGAI